MRGTARTGVKDDLALATGSKAELLAYGRAELERPWLNDDDGDDEDDVPF